MTYVGVIIGVLLLGIAFYGGVYLSVSYLSNFMGVFWAFVVTFILLILILRLLTLYDTFQTKNWTAKLENELKKLKKDK